MIATSGKIANDDRIALARQLTAILCWGILSIDLPIRGRRMRERIEIDPNIHFGKPCVAGTRIPVQNVLELVKEGIPFEAIIRDYYPDLSVEDVQACVQYAIEVVAAEDLHIAVPAS
jgi:uncharacterized protein (DUF433 family)